MIAAARARLAGGAGRTRSTLHSILAQRRNRRFGPLYGPTLYGISSEFPRSVVTYRHQEHGREGRVTALNKLPHSQTKINGIAVDRKKDETPLLLVNRWLSSFVEDLCSRGLSARAS